jgi:hypothetical protein
MKLYISIYLASLKQLILKIPRLFTWFCGRKSTPSIHMIFLCYGCNPLKKINIFNLEHFLIFLDQPNDGHVEKRVVSCATDLVRSTTLVI